MVSYRDLKLKKERQDEIRRLDHQVEELRQRVRDLVALIRANAKTQEWAREVVDERRD